MVIEDNKSVQVILKWRFLHKTRHNWVSHDGSVVSEGSLIKADIFKPTLTRASQVGFQGTDLGFWSKLGKIYSKQTVFFVLLVFLTLGRWSVPRSCRIKEKNQVFKHQKELLSKRKITDRNQRWFSCFSNAFRELVYTFTLLLTANQTMNLIGQRLDQNWSI